MKSVLDTEAPHGIGAAIPLQLAMNRLRVFVSMLSLLMTPSIFAQSSGGSIAGDWLTADNEGTVRVYEENGKYFGQLIQGRNRKDTKNPNPALRDRDVAGTVIMTGFVYDGKGEWKRGKVYSPDNGKTYSGTLKLENLQTMLLRGYVGVPLLGRTERWTRKGEDAKAEPTSK
jgi:uncharacterized protein (DUF2147 family)